MTDYKRAWVDLTEKYDELHDDNIALEAELAAYKDSGNLTHLGVKLKIEQLQAQVARLREAAEHAWVFMLDDLPKRNTAKRRAYEKLCELLGYDAV